MKIFHLYNKNHHGFIELSYNEKGHLVIVNCDQLETHNPSLMRSLMTILPTTLTELEVWVGADSSRTCIEKDYQPKFEDFYNQYGRKINRARAEKQWAKMNNNERHSAIKSIKKYESFLKMNQWRQKQDPDTFLNAKMWESDFSKM